MSFFKGLVSYPLNSASCQAQDNQTAKPEVPAVVGVLEEETLSCPLCCNDLPEADIKIPLQCPTTTCRFCFCNDCLMNMQSASMDDYGEASDGSHQVKIKLACPQCRMLYQSAGYSSEVVVESVLLLRNAYSVQMLLRCDDDHLNSSALALKNEFCHYTSVEQVNMACRQLDGYNREIGKPSSSNSNLLSTTFDYDFLSCHLLGNASSCSTRGVQATQSSLATRNTTNNSNQNWKDPTLFLGLESVLTSDEQEFLTQLLIRGQPELLVQASFILHQVIDNHNDRSHPSRSTTNRIAGRKQGTVSYDPNKILKIRQRYPLPPRMPVCVPITMHLIRKLQLKDNNNKNHHNDEDEDEHLTIKSTRGGTNIGKHGVRPGDTLTHVGDTPVSNRSEFDQALQRHWDATATTTATTAGEEMERMIIYLTVNASQATADALQERAHKMQIDKVRFT